MIGRALIYKKNLTISEHQYKYLLRNRQKREKEGKILALSVNGTTDDETNLWKKCGELFYSKYNIQLKIYCGGSKTILLFKHKEEANCVVSLLYNDTNKNYGVILSKTGFFGSRYYCESCNTAHSHLPHACTALCRKCGVELEKHSQKRESLNLRELLHCQICNREFYYNECFVFHKDTLCKKSYLCDCGKAVGFEDKDSHTCDLERFCRICKVKYNPILSDTSHSCFMRPVKIGKASYDKIVFFDFEAIVNNEDDHVSMHSPNARFVHEVNVVCAKVYAIDGRNSKFLYDFDHFGDNALPAFCEEFLCGKYRDVLFVAHGGSFYDFIHIQRYTVFTLKIYPKVIANGSKIMSMSFSNNLCFIDSFNFLKMPLKKFPETFGLNHVSKGVWPYHFNQPKFYNYCGPMPDKKYYGYHEMSEKKKEEFLKWYNKNVEEDYIFHFKKEIMSYCRMDSLLLSLGCLKFRELLMDMTSGVDPFDHALTMASLSMRILRTLFLPKETVLIIPRKRLNSQIRTSKIAVGYLDWLNQSRGKKERILHQQNNFSGEQRIGRFSLDGWIPGKRHAYEVNGCLYHGCRTCFPNNRDQKMPLKLSDTVVEIASHNGRYERTERKRKWLTQKCGITLETIWTCQIPRNLRRSIYDQQHFAIRPGMGFYGGRTEVFTSLLKSDDHYSLRYYDICSLYPYVLRDRDFPLGLCNIIRPLAENIQITAATLGEYFGLAMVKILPPSRIYLPVLPYRCKIGKSFKTVFALCKTCAEDTSSVKLPAEGEELDLKRSSICSHSSEQRAFLGVWPIVELLLALKKDYKLLQVYEVWDFPKKSKVLFEDFIRTFSKLKTMASGFPKNIKSTEEKKEYLKKIKEEDDIELEMDEISFNSGIRALSKLVQNSSWGKFGENEHRRKKYVYSASELVHLLKSEKIIVHYVDPISADCALVEFSMNDDSINSVVETETEDSDVNTYFHSSSTVNVVIAALTTAWARCYLYEHIENIPPHDLLLTDTDSAIFRERNSEKDSLIPLKNCLGGFCDEIVKNYGENAKLVSVIACGPKQYSLKIHDSVNQKYCEEVKIRGFGWNSVSERELTHNTMESMIRKMAEDWNNTAPQVVKIPYDHLFRDKQSSNISSGILEKKYKPVCDKRFKWPNSFYSLPFGFGGGGGGVND